MGDATAEAAPVVATAAAELVAGGKVAELAVVRAVAAGVAVAMPVATPVAMTAVAKLAMAA